MKLFHPLPILVLALTACTAGDNATPALAINSNGSKIVVAWPDGQRTSAHEINLSPTGIASVNALSLPSSVISLAFAHRSTDLLIATLAPDRTGHLIRRPATGEVISVYTHPYPIRFILEAEPGKYVFLAGKVREGAGTWMSLENGVATEQSSRVFRLATHINYVSHSYFLLEPGKSASLVPISGQLPDYVHGLVKNNTGALRCANDADRSCLAVYHNVMSSHSYSEIEFRSQTLACKPRDTWQGFSDAVLSEDGKVAAFIAQRDNKRRLFIFYPAQNCRIIEMQP